MDVIANEIFVSSRKGFELMRAIDPKTILNKIHFKNRKNVKFILRNTPVIKF